MIEPHEAVVGPSGLDDTRSDDLRADTGRRLLQALLPAPTSADLPQAGPAAAGDAALGALALPQPIGPMWSWSAPVSPWPEAWPAAAPASDRPRFLDGTLVVRLEPGGSGDGEPARAAGVFRFTDADLHDVHTVAVRSATTPAGGALVVVLDDAATGDGLGTVRWTYELDAADLHSLREGRTVSDRYDVVVTDADGLELARQVRVVVSGTNDVALISGTSTGTASEDGRAEATGRLEVRDPDRWEAALQPLTAPGTGGYGTFEVSAHGEWRYALANDSLAVQQLGHGQRVLDGIDVRSRDGSATQRLEIVVTGVADDATVDGDRAGTVEEGGVSVTRGRLRVSDVDAGEAAVQAWRVVGTTTTRVGSFEVDRDGFWTYQLAQDHPRLLMLGAGQPLVERYDVVSVDGSGFATVEIRIVGRDEVRPNVLDVNRLTPDQGFVLRGGRAGDFMGERVGAAGDVDGDGRPDLLLRGIDQQAVVVHADALGGGVLDAAGRRVVGLAGLEPDQAMRVSAPTTREQVVARAGDLNGDGRDDLVVGHDRGAWVVYGDGEGRGARTQAGLQAGEGVVIEAGDGRLVSIASVASAGDVDGDGYDDLIVGAPQDGAAQAGAAYLVRGGPDGPGQADGTGAPAVLRLDALTPDEGLVIGGAHAYARAGQQVASVGDFDGDGLSDLVIGSHGLGDGSQGRTWMVRGAAVARPDVDSLGRASLDLSELPADAGFMLRGGSIEARGAGDLNGDGLSDLVLPLLPGNLLGVVLYGSRGPVGELDESGRRWVDPDHLRPDQGFVIAGGGPLFGDIDHLRAEAAGDVNGDGYDDLVLGLPFGLVFDDDTQTGHAYVILGRAGGFGQRDVAGRDSIDLRTLRPSDGLALEGGDAVNLIGYDVAGLGDVDGDGYDDVLVGAPLGTGRPGDAPGDTYLVYGRPGDAPVAPVQRQGTAGNDTIVGSLHADRLDGRGGGDVLRGGAGDDRFSVRDAGFRQVDGGTGQDTLVLGGPGMTLDLTGRAAGRVSDVETIDLRGSGAHRLVLDAGSVFDLSALPNAAFTGAGTLQNLVVDGGAGDTLVLGLGGAIAGADWQVADGTWALDGTTGGGYQVVRLLRGDDLLAAVAVGADVVLEVPNLLL